MTNGLPTFLRTSVTSIAIENAKMQAEDDRLRREVEQQRRQEQLAKMAADAPEEQRHDPTPRANVREARAKRQRQSEVDAANAMPT